MDTSELPQPGNPLKKINDDGIVTGAIRFGYGRIRSGKPTLNVNRTEGLNHV
jgi:hypothetical protein